jgi:hypothetical protein
MQLRDALRILNDQDLDNAATITRNALPDSRFADMTYTELYIRVLKGMAIARLESN